MSIEINKPDDPAFLEKNTTAIVGFILSTAGFVLLLAIIIVFGFLDIENDILGNLLCLGMIGGTICGLICSAIGLRKNKKGRKFAMAGIVFSAIPIAAFIISIIYYLIRFIVWLF